MAPAKPTQKTDTWYNRPYRGLLLAFAAFGVACLIGLRSLDTGSWQQYGLTLLFLSVGLNRAAHATAKLRVKKGSRT